MVTRAREPRPERMQSPFRREVFGHCSARTESGESVIVPAAVASVSRGPSQKLGFFDSFSGTSGEAPALLRVSEAPERRCRD